VYTSRALSLVVVVVAVGSYSIEEVVAFVHVELVVDPF